MWIFSFFWLSLQLILLAHENTVERKVMPEFFWGRFAYLHARKSNFVWKKTAELPSRKRT